MKKKLSVLLITSLAMLSVVACGSDSETDSATTDSQEGTATTEAIVASDYITLPTYDAVPTEAVLFEIGEADVEEYIEYALSNQTELVEVTGRAVEAGDIVNIDYTGTKDGVAFEGGSTDGTPYDLEIGSGTFIPGFEDGIIGMEVGDTKVIELTFPEEYHSEDLSGADVEFEVVLHKITVSETPALTDELVATLEESVSTIDEYKEFVRVMLEEEAATSYDMELSNAVFLYIMENATYEEMPESLIEYYIGLQDDMVTMYAEAYQMDRDTFITSMFGQTVEEYEEEARMVSGEMAKEYVTFKAVGEAEGFIITDEDVQTFADENYELAGAPSAEEYIAMVGSQQIELALLSELLLPELIKYASIEAE